MYKFLQKPVFNSNLFYTILVSLIILAICILPIGLYNEFITFFNITPFFISLALAFRTFFVPALFEEFIFRGWLFPHSFQKSFKYYLKVALSVIGFVIIHIVIYVPLVILFFDIKIDLFLSWQFLYSATILGIVLSYLRIKYKSIWPAVFVHWVVDSFWLIFLGGFGLLVDEGVDIILIPYIF